MLAHHLPARTVGEEVILASVNRPTLNGWKPGSAPGGRNGARKTYDVQVWVQSKDCRGPAFTVANGKWMNFHTGKKLADIIEVIG